MEMYNVKKIIIQILDKIYFKIWARFQNLGYSKTAEKTKPKI